MTLELKKFEKFSSTDFWGSLNRGVEKNNRLIVSFSSSTFREIAIRYAEIQGSIHLEIDRVDDLQKHLNHSSIFIIAEDTRLDFETLQSVIEIQLTNSMPVGIVTGRSEKEVLFMLYKNHQLKIKTMEGSGISISPLKSTESSHYYFRESIPKNVFTSHYKHAYLFGGGRIDQVSIGKDLVLRGDLNSNSHREVILTESLKVDLLCINGCVAGVVSPKSFEKEGNRVLSHDIFTSSTSMLIAPISTKLSNEYEGELFNNLLEETSFSIGEICLHLNLYCLNAGMEPKYMLYGDPAIILNNKNDSRDGRLKKISNTFGNKSLFSLSKSYQYYNVNASTYFFSYKEDLNLENIVEQNLAETSNTFLKQVKTFKNYMELNFVKKMVTPKFNTHQEKLKKNIEWLEKNYQAIKCDTNINQAFHDVLRENNTLMTKIEKENLLYWFSNIEKDKIRLYDLHYSQYLIAESLNSERVCPVCKDYKLKNQTSYSLFNNFRREVALCPSCSIVEDLHDSHIHLDIISSRKKNGHLNVTYSVSNLIKESLNAVMVTAVRGRNDKILDSFDLMIPGNTKVRLEKTIHLSSLNSEDNRIYLSFIVFSDAKMYYFKRPL